MTHTFSTLVIVFSFLFTTTLVGQGSPFGISMGQSIENLSCENLEDNAYRCDTLPKPHPDMEFYVVWYHPDTGITSVRGVTETIENDRRGHSVSGQVDKLANQISGRYGQWDDQVDKNYDDLYDEADEWAMSMARGERFYFYHWKDKITFPDIKSIEVSAEALSNHETYTKVTFIFSNNEILIQIEEEEGQDAF